MKRSNLFFSLLFGLSLLACGGGSEVQEDTTETTETSEEGNGPEAEAPSEDAGVELVCMEFASAQKEVYYNLRFEGNEVTGVADHYHNTDQGTYTEYYNIKGTRAGDQLKLKLTLSDGNYGNDVGSSYAEQWVYSGESMGAPDPEESIVPGLERFPCEGDGYFYREPGIMADGLDFGTETNTYRYEGVIDGKYDIVMELEASLSPEDATITLLTGYYYYKSQGADKKIQLEGSIAEEVDVMGVPNMLVEVKDGKEYGRFVLEPGDRLGEKIYCSWFDASAEKELDAMLVPAD